ncbi:MAG TPA: sensor domain-containing protein [Streptosporangiaceae bacterium]|jgi:hypothetical protein
MGASRLRLRLDPVRLLFSASLWQAVGYLFSYQIVSGVLFAIALTAAVMTTVLGITVAAVPLLVATAWTVRGCATFARLMVGQVRRRQAAGGYQDAPVTGLMRRARRLWASGATWRDLAYLVGLWPFLFALTTAVLAVWATFLGGITVPLWYSHVSDFCVAGNCTTQHVPGLMFGQFPHGPHGPAAHGLYVDSLGPALLVAGAGLVLFLLFNYVVVAAAQLLGTVTAAVLRYPSDPLAPAKEVLADAGPLGPLLQPGRPTG